MANIPLDWESTVDDLNFKSRLDLNLNLTASLGCCRRSRHRGFHASSGRQGSMQKWSPCRSGQAAPTLLLSILQLPGVSAARSLQNIAGWCITVLHHCYKGRRLPPAMYMSAPPLHSSKLEKKRGLASSTCSIFGPNFLLQRCSHSVSISAATAHVFSRQGALWSFPSLANHLHIVMFKTQLPSHKYS